MWFYIIGLGCAIYGSMSMQRSISELDPQRLRAFISICTTAAFLFFVWGFFVYAWYAPLLGVFVVAPILSFIMIMLQPKDGYGLLWAFKDHMVTLLGFLLCISNLIF